MTAPNPEKVAEHLALDPFEPDCLHCALQAFILKRFALRHTQGKDPGNNDRNHVAFRIGEFLGEVCSSGGSGESAYPALSSAMAGMSQGAARCGIPVVPVMEVFEAPAPEAPPPGTPIN